MAFALKNTQSNAQRRIISKLVERVINKTFELMFTRRAKAYSSSGSVV